MELPKGTKLFIILGGFFIANALLAEVIGVKIFSLEETLGWQPFSFKFFGNDQLSMLLTAGVLLWPVVFIMTDVINEYFGRPGVRLLSFLAAGLIIYAFLAIYLAINLVPASFWIGVNVEQGVPDMQSAFSAIFGQGLWIIAGSVVAFLIGQLVDVITFHRIKRITGEGKIWARATGSTLISQLIDSFVVLFIAFYIGADWELSLVLAIMVVNYIYKVFMAIVLTPLIYVAHALIDNYLGKEESEKLRAKASASNIGILK
jgi:uncharacterized integral membrane protein (TIGR00697 family)